MAASNMSCIEVITACPADMEKGQSRVENSKDERCRRH
jgi:hypothetical protein